MSYIELENGLEWINAGKIVGVHYENKKISLMYLGASNAVVVSNINRDYAAGIMKDMIKFDVRMTRRRLFKVEDWLEQELSGGVGKDFFGPDNIMTAPDGTRYYIEY